MIHDLEGAPQIAAVVSGELETEGAGGSWPEVLSGLKTVLETGESLRGLNEHRSEWGGAASRRRYLGRSGRAPGIPAPHGRGRAPRARAPSSSTGTVDVPFRVRRWRPRPPVGSGSRSGPDRGSIPASAPHHWSSLAGGRAGVEASPGPELADEDHRLARLHLFPRLIASEASRGWGAVGAPKGRDREAGGPGRDRRGPERVCPPSHSPPRDATRAGCSGSGGTGCPGRSALQGLGPS